MASNRKSLWLEPEDEIPFIDTCITLVLYQYAINAHTVGEVDQESEGRDGGNWGRLWTPMAETMGMLLEEAAL